MKRRIMTESTDALLTRLASQYLGREKLISLGAAQAPRVKPLAASSALIAEVNGRNWRYHLGHFGPESDDIVEASVYPADDVPTLAQMQGR